jgi:CrcB-like protein, Camphor Resistance (CrcB)
VLGSFLMGFLFFATLERIKTSPELRTGILTGGLVAYTTFSTFSLETLNLIENGEMVKAGLYVAGSVVLSIAAAVFGAYLSRNPDDLLRLTVHLPLVLEFYDDPEVMASLLSRIRPMVPAGHIVS